MKTPIPVELDADGNAPLTLLDSLRKTPLTRMTVVGLSNMRNALSRTKDKKIGSRVSEDLLSAVKTRLNVKSDTEAIELALVNMAITDDFGSWLVSQTGALTEDFTLEL